MDDDPIGRWENEGGLIPPHAVSPIPAWWWTRRPPPGCLDPIVESGLMPPGWRDPPTREPSRGLFQFFPFTFGGHDGG
jgi:hypothetical protein